ncbi:hypothetical protein CROQUDRAFT_85464 [Cronartium quercuum f. sp. fusiforme G11]|uniref:Uncharacterized protein n=1 Tax=Cronartium quercuum f. sp. fusiforme G11 TaxID=708437 RepID=A0A9P6NUW4_9BASI|nr:hypothetical protein CROQUDRAFT_85464 [Cronartium quercuum f. sp. fusiforme G11]
MSTSTTPSPQHSQPNNLQTKHKATSKDGTGGAGSFELVAPPPGSQLGDHAFFQGFENKNPIEQLVDIQSMKVSKVEAY